MDDTHEHEPSAQTESPIAQDAQRRNLIKQRARELKRSLLESTVHLSPEEAVSAYNRAVRRANEAKRRSAPFLQLALVLLLGAMSMLVPFPSTYHLPGRLNATAAVGAAPQALVQARIAQCSRLQLDRTATVSVDAPGLEAAKLTARIVQIAPQAGSAGAATCQVELQFLADANITTAVSGMRHGAPVIVALAAEPRSWLSLLAERTPEESTFAEASTKLRGQLELVRRQSRALLAHLRNARTAEAADTQPSPDMPFAPSPSDLQVREAEAP